MLDFAGMSVGWRRDPSSLRSTMLIFWSTRISPQVTVQMIKELPVQTLKTFVGPQFNVVCRYYHHARHHHATAETALRGKQEQICKRGHLRWFDDGHRRETAPRGNHVPSHRIRHR